MTTSERTHLSRGGCADLRAGSFGTGLLCILILLCAGAGRAQIRSVNLDRSYPVIEAENNVWIGTPEGLHQYNPDDDTFKRISLPREATSSAIRHLRYNDEYIWCILDEGLAALHVRLGEWLWFDTSTGLPSDSVTGIAFDDEYAWISGPGGIARFDLLIEEWESFPTDTDTPEIPLHDIVAGDERIWTIGNRTISEYDPTFEKWHHYEAEQDDAASLRRIFRVGDDLWLVSDEGLIRFDVDLRDQQSFFIQDLAAADLLDLLVEDDTVWALTRSGIYHYDSETQTWVAFEGNSHLLGVTPAGFYKDPSSIWIVSADDVSVWDESDRNWEALDYASGLSLSDYGSVYTAGGMTFLLGQGAVDYRRGNEERWRTYSTGTAGGRGPGQDVFTDLFDNEEGGNIHIGKHRWGWEGTRITLLRDYEWLFADGGRDGDPAVRSGERLDVKSRIRLGGEQTVSGFYNNIDFSEVMYGIRYRDRGDAIFQEIGWGDFQREPGSTPFGQPSNMFGSYAWLQAGGKTPRYRRSLVALKAHTGERRSEKTYEHFTGALNHFEISFEDTDYLKNQFYSIPGLGAREEPGRLRVYVDDLNPSNSTPNTLEHHTIAGVTGDFDVLTPTEEYYFDRRAGMVRFLTFVSSEWTLAVRFSSGGMTYEEVLQSAETVSTVGKNVYYLKGLHIIPYSLELGIRDSLGNAVSLGDFGLDADRNGRVDSEWIDYKNGMLIFPETLPFPPEVYDETSPRSFYEIEADFDTQISLIQLAHSDLVRGSDVLKLDGSVAQGGNDYVLDYTNGTLVFVREGILNPDTRIEIEYEFYPGDDLSRVSSAALNLSPHDDFYVQGDWVSIDHSRTDDDGETVDASDMLSLHSEIRRTLCAYDIRLTPGIAYQADAGRLGAGYLEGVISSPVLRVQAGYQDYSEAYTNLYRPRSVIGTVKENIDLFASLDIRNDVRLTGEWSRVEGYKGRHETSPSDRSAGATLLLHRRNLPSLEVSYRSFKTAADSGSSEREVVQSRLKYQLPSVWAGKLGLKGLKADALFRTGKRRGDPVAGTEDQEFRQALLRLNSTISDRFRAGFFYRRTDLRDFGAGGSPPVLRSERSLVNLSHEEWRILQVNFRTENSMERGFHRNSPSADVSLNQYSQANLRFSAGALWNGLTGLDFEFNVNRSLTADGSTDRDAASWLWEVFNEDAKGLATSRIATTWFAKNEYRPSTKIYLYTLLEWNRQEKVAGGSRLISRYRRWTEKMDLKLNFTTRLSLQYRDYFQDSGFGRTSAYHEPSAWLEHRWTPDLQDIVELTYRRSRSDDGASRNESRDWDARYDLIWRVQGLVGIRRTEMRQGISGARSRTRGHMPEYTYDLAYSSSIDLYPLHSTVLRTQVRFSRHWDRLISANDYHDLAVDLKVSFRF